MSDSPHLTVPLQLIISEEFQSAFGKLARDPSALVHPKQEAWTMARVQKNIDSAWKNFATARSNIAQRHGGPTDPKGPPMPPENLPKFNEEVLEMVRATTVELFTDHKFLVYDPIPNDSKLLPIDLMALGDIIEPYVKPPEPPKEEPKPA